MKIVHWDEMFHPTFGYQINLLPKLQAMQGHEVSIITSENIQQHPYFKSFVSEVDIEEWDRRYEAQTGVKIIRLPIYTVISGRVIYKGNFIKRINDEQPDIVFCHGNDTLSAIQIVKKHKKIKAPLIFDNHMLDMASVNKFNWLFRFYFRHFVTPLYKKNGWIVFRTQDDNYVSNRLGIPKEQAPFLSFGSDLSLFKPDGEVKHQVRQELGIAADATVVLYAGKLTQEKGGLFLANSLTKGFNTDKKVVFLIIGNAPDTEVEQAFLSTENTIIRLPTQNYVDLPRYYQCADFALFPRQVSLSFFDVQACGLPVIASSNNINDERLSHENGCLYTLDDMKDFRNKIEYLLNLDSSEFEKMKDAAVEYIKQNYDYSDIASECTDIMTAEIRRQKEQGIVKD